MGPGKTFHQWLEPYFKGIQLDTPLSETNALPLDEVIYLQPRSNRIYGHFLIEVLPRLLIANEEWDKKLPIYFDFAHSTYKEAVQSLGIPLSRFINPAFHPLIQSKCLYLVDYTKRWGRVGCMDQLKFLQRWAATDDLFTGEGAGVNSSVRLFVARHDGGEGLDGRFFRSSSLNNNEALESRLSALGFQTVYPERLSFRQQVHLFSRAQVVVGEHGSGMFNTLFCQPDTLVIDLHPACPNPTLFDVLSTLDINYQPILTPEGSMIKWQKKRFNIDISLVEKALRDNAIN